MSNTVTIVSETDKTSNISGLMVGWNSQEKGYKWMLTSLRTGGYIMTEPTEQVIGTLTQTFVGVMDLLAAWESHSSL